MQADTILDVVRIDHPDYEKPLLLGTIARELTTEQIWSGYNHRSPIETNFFVAQDSAGMEMPRAWTLEFYQTPYWFSHAGGVCSQSDRSQL